MLCAFFKPIIKFFKNPLIYGTLRNKDCTHETCVLTLQTRGKKRYDNVMLKLECKKNPLLTKYMKVNSPYRWLVQKYCSKFIGSLHDFFQGGWTPVQLKIFLQLKWKKYLHKKNHLKIQTTWRLLIIFYGKQSSLIHHSLFQTPKQHAKTQMLYPPRLEITCQKQMQDNVMNA